MCRPCRSIPKFRSVPGIPAVQWVLAGLAVLEAPVVPEVRYFLVGPVFRSFRRFRSSPKFRQFQKIRWCPLFQKSPKSLLFQKSLKCSFSPMKFR